MNLTQTTLVLMCTALMLNSPVYAAKKSAKKIDKAAVEAAPEMRIDPNLMNTYQSGAQVESKRVESSDVQFVAVEPTIDFHLFTSFHSQNEYFDVPLNGGSKSAIAPAVWLGHPTGAVWGGVIRARLGLNISYLMFDGAQTVHQRTIDQDFRDNVSAHVLPMVATVRLTSATKSEFTFGIAPWITAGGGMMLTQVSGNLDGVSQSAWTPISKLGAGLRYSLSTSNGIVGGVHAGAFAVSGSSRKAEWRGTGLTFGADLVL
jgi:hypothetical protein